jgi:FlaA1/EpsC-like NDP-sugar epimerase
MVGRALVARYHERYRILAHGRDQRGLNHLRACHPGIAVVQGELTSPALAEAIEASQFVVHAAGQKHPDLAWHQVAATFETNALASRRLAEISCAAGVERFVFTSTIRPTESGSVLAQSKFLAERLLLELGNSSGTSFVVCRFAPIVTSYADGLRPWMESLRWPKGRLQVSHPDLTRFLFTLDEAVDLVDFALHRARQGDIVVPRPRAFRLGDLLGLLPGGEALVTGLPPGVDLHEKLFLPGEINTGHYGEGRYVFNPRGPLLPGLERLDSSRVERLDVSRVVGIERERLAA